MGYLLRELSQKWHNLLRRAGATALPTRTSSRVDPRNIHRSPQGVASGPDEQYWKGEKCWWRREILGAELRLLVLYVV